MFSILIFFALVSLLAAHLEGWNPFDSSEAKAREAIEIAAQACGVGNRLVFAEKLVDAKVAIRHVPGMKTFELDAVLDNRLKQVGCSTD